MGQGFVQALLVLGSERYTRRNRLDGVEFDFFAIACREAHGGFGRDFRHERDFVGRLLHVFTSFLYFWINGNVPLVFERRYVKLTSTDGRTSLSSKTASRTKSSCSFVSRAKSSMP